MKLTPHFDTVEFAQHAAHGLPATAVPEKLRPNLLRLCTALEELRAYLGAPCTIMSGWRSAQYNKACGGAPSSRHITAEAADVQFENVAPKTVHGAIEHLIAAGKMPQGGLGLYAGWVHYDVRGSKARWDNTVNGKRG